MMMLKMKNIAGLVLCTLILSASVPLMLGIQETPKTVFGGDMVAVSQVNSTTRLNASMVETLKIQTNVVAASAEISCFSVIKDSPVLIRGVNLDDFLEIEGSQLVRGTVDDPNRFAVVGRKLANKINLEVGDRFLLTGSSNSAIFQMKIDAIYEGIYSEDELLVPLAYARKMAGLGEESVLFIRVKTTNQTALMETLEQQEQPVVVTTSNGLVTPVNTQITEEERAQQQLAIKYLDNAQFKASNGSYVSIFVREGANSIKVVVTTFIVLDSALAFIGSAAIVSRAIIERRHEIGIISAVGADRNYLRKIIARDVLIMSVLASFLGVFIGYLMVRLIEDQGLLLMFGETIHAVINPYILAGIFSASVIIHTTSGLLIENTLSKVKPKDLMQETEKVEREVDAQPLSQVLGVDA
jgi:ABC-type antimicrobial peptide transport system permease subunit